MAHEFDTGEHLKAGGGWDVALDEDEITALAAGASPLEIRPEHLVGFISGEQSEAS